MTDTSSLSLTSSIVLYPACPAPRRLRGPCSKIVPSSNWDVLIQPPRWDDASSKIICITQQLSSNFKTNPSSHTSKRISLDVISLKKRRRKTQYQLALFHLINLVMCTIPHDCENTIDQTSMFSKTEFWVPLWAGHFVYLSTKLLNGKS